MPGIVGAAPMSWVIYLFGSGQAFFDGVVLILFGVALVSVRPRPWRRSLGVLAAFIGLALIAVSATPLPYGLYCLAGAVSLAWLVLQGSKRQSWQQARRWSGIGVIAAWMTAAAIELPYQLPPTLTPMGRPALYLFADSVSAGMGEKGLQTWPRALAQEHAIEVNDFSVAGATIRTAIRKAEKAHLGDGIVLLEIGGNDLLGDTPVAQFERDLDELLTLVCGPGRRALLMELPLLPFANEFGRAQRRVAARHSVALVPKRMLVSVLTADGATVDSIHLTQHGQEIMAKAVWQLIGSAYAE